MVCCVSHLLWKSSCLTSQTVIHISTFVISFRVTNTGNIKEVPFYEGPRSGSGSESGSSSDNSPILLEGKWSLKESRRSQLHVNLHSTSVSKSYKTQRRFTVDVSRTVRHVTKAVVVAVSSQELWLDRLIDGFTARSFSPWPFDSISSKVYYSLSRHCFYCTLLLSSGCRKSSTNPPSNVPLARGTLIYLLANFRGSRL